MLDICKWNPALAGYAKVAKKIKVILPRILQGRSSQGRRRQSEKWHYLHHAEIIGAGRMGEDGNQSIGKKDECIWKITDRVKKERLKSEVSILGERLSEFGNIHSGADRWMNLEGILWRMDKCIWAYTYLRGIFFSDMNL